MINMQSRKKISEREDVLPLQIVDSTDRKPPNKKIEAILKGAMQEFLTHGFAATTMDNITAVAGVSKATVYSYFPDKEALFIALMEHLIQRKWAILDRLNPDLFQGEPTQVVFKIANIFIDRFSESVGDTPELLDLLRLAIAESGRFPHLTQSLILSKDKQFVDSFTQYLQAHPELGLIDAGATARVLLGTLVHFMMVEYIFQAKEIFPMERQRLVNCLVSLITGQQKIEEDKYAAIKNKSSRRKRSSSGTFEQEYDEPKHLRSIRVTDTAWENLDAMAQKNNLTRTELIEKLARGISIQ
jgi:AcrR family transcriptional regulator